MIANSSARCEIRNDGQGGTIKKKMYEVDAEIWASL